MCSFIKFYRYNALITFIKMSRLTQLASIISLASLGFAQNIPNIIPFTVTGSLDGYVYMSLRPTKHLLIVE